MTPDGTGPNLVPPPPTRAALKRHRPRRGTDRRVWLWPLCLGAGIGLGVLGYQFVPNVDFYFDYWVALLAS